MWIGWTEFDLLLGDVHSLKEKRAIVRPIVAELRKATEASVAEVGDQDLHRRAEIGIAVTAGSAGWITDVLDRAERIITERPDVTVLAERRRLLRSDDE
jgi:uncharacterized protein YlxP (DUF503 family)